MLFHFCDKLTIGEELRLYYSLSLYYENYGKYITEFGKKTEEVNEIYNFYENIYVLGNSRYERVILVSLYRNIDTEGAHFWIKSYIQPDFKIKEVEFVDILRKGYWGIKEIVEYFNDIKNLYYLQKPLADILLRPVSEEFINLLTLSYRYGRELIDIIGYPYIVEKPSIEFARSLIKSIEEYHRNQGLYKPHVNYTPSKLSDEMKVFIAWWRRFLLYDYGIKTGEKVLIDLNQCNRLPLGESIIERLGGLEIPVLLNGNINPMPKHHIMNFIEKMETLKGGEGDV